MTRPMRTEAETTTDNGSASRLLLEVDSLKVRFKTSRGTVKAVNGVSYELRAGDTLGIVGESGSGKTVAALSLMRLLPRGKRTIVEGTVVLDGVDVTKLSSREIRRLRGKDFAMIFQDPLTSLNPALTIERQLTEALLEHEEIDRSEARERATQLLEVVGIPDADDRLYDYPHRFSGGMRQRVMVAMALACDPKLIIADEPTTALDVTIQAQVLDLLKRTVSERQAALILITHDLGVVAGMCRRVLVMYGGIVVEEAETTELFRAPKHPYTAALMGSVPRLDVPRDEELVTIKGQPPDSIHPPSGCPFAPRCSRVEEDCLTVVPPIEEVGTSAAPHRVACFHPLET
jgi:oligopeptide transport system ATP-binding protein